MDGVEASIRKTAAQSLGLPWLLRTVALVLSFLSGPVGFLIYIPGRWFLRQEAAVE